VTNLNIAARNHHAPFDEKRFASDHFTPTHNDVVVRVQ
jgi:hypothetical protein